MSFDGHSKSECHWNERNDNGMTGMGTPPSLPQFMSNDPGMTFLSFQRHSGKDGMGMNGMELATFHIGIVHNSNW